MRAAALALAALLLPLAGAKGDGQSPGDKDYIDSPWVGNGVAPNGTTKVRGAVTCGGETGSAFGGEQAGGWLPQRAGRLGAAERGRMGAAKLGG